MADFTEQQINGMIDQLKEDLDPEVATRELAILELEDLKRKGCLLEESNGSCYKCSVMRCGGECPMNDWDRRHPEYMNDELAKKIKILEAGGEEAYAAKQKKHLEAIKEKSDLVSLAKDARSHIVACMVPTDGTTAALELEKYVQIRINMALKHSMTTLD